ncbi:MAG: hypothetical protein K2N34_02685 [Lachnospiraceae bacterium]|nr:hypothetical protein [Lachnospiraceae bacterium]
MNYKLGLEKSKIVYPEGWGTGFPLWTDKGWQFQNKTLENLMQQFSDDYNIMIHYPNIATEMDEYSNLYGSRIMHYDNSFPTYSDDGHDMLIITDSLPYNLKEMKAESFNAMLTYYYVIRLLKSKKIPMYRDYYISPLLQLNLAISDMSKELAISYVMGKTQTFLKNIGLPAIALEYDGVPGYSEKVYMFASCNSKGNLSTIVQCSLIDKDLLNSFGVLDYFGSKYVFDLGYSQKIFAFIADNNMDKFGVRWPSFFEQNDVVVVYKELSDLQKRELTNYPNVILDDRLGKKKLKSIKKEHVNNGVRYMFVQRRRNGKEFFSFYTKDGVKDMLYKQMLDLIHSSRKELDNTYYVNSEILMNKQIQFGIGHVSEFTHPGKVVSFF